MRTVLLLAMLYAGITAGNGYLLASSAEQTLLNRQAVIDHVTK